jgi:hypothetical protein
MERHEFGDETLMAYADGELDAGTARAVEAAAAADADLAARIAMFARTGEVLAAAGRARPMEPLPPALDARVDAILRGARAAPAETVVPFRPRRVLAPAFRPMAAAAALALAVGVAGGLLVSQATSGRDGGGLRIAALDAPGIAAALDTLPSGERVAVGDGELATIASFLNADGEFCREFEFDRTGRDTVVTVACRAGPCGSRGLPSSRAPPTTPAMRRPPRSTRSTPTSAPSARARPCRPRRKRRRCGRSHGSARGSGAAGASLLRKARLRDRPSPDKPQEEPPPAGEQRVEQRRPPRGAEERALQGVHQPAGIGQRCEEVHGIFAEEAPPLPDHHHAPVEVEARGRRLRDAGVAGAGIDKLDRPCRLAQAHHGDVGGAERALPVVDDRDAITHRRAPRFCRPGE